MVRNCVGGPPGVGVSWFFGVLLGMSWAGEWRQRCLDSAVSSSACFWWGSLGWGGRTPTQARVRGVLGDPGCHCRARRAPRVIFPSVSLSRWPILMILRCENQGYMCTCGWFTLRFDRKQQHSVKQVCFNKKINKKNQGNSECVSPQGSRHGRTPSLMQSGEVGTYVLTPILLRIKPRKREPTWLPGPGPGSRPLHGAELGTLPSLDSTHGHHQMVSMESDWLYSL